MSSNFLLIEDFGDLYIDIQQSAIFSDSKYFVDCVPKFSTQQIIEKYQLEKIKKEVQEEVESTRLQRRS